MKQIIFTATCSGRVDIYTSVSWTPCLCSRDALTTGTPNQFLWTNAHLDTRIRWTPHLSSRDALTTGTPNQFLWTNAHLDTRIRWTPHLSSIDALTTSTANQFYMDKYTLRYESDEPPKLQPKAVHCIQLYILCSFIYVVTLYILSFGSWATGQVSHAFISIEHFCQFTCDCMMLLLLCITQEQKYVVVVVYYTTTTRTTTRFI